MRSAASRASWPWAWASAALKGSGSMRASTAPAATAWPSVKATSSSGPSTRVRTTTWLRGTTLPMAGTWTRMSAVPTVARLTGVGRSPRPPGPPGRPEALLPLPFGFASPSGAAPRWLAYQPPAAISTRATAHGHRRRFLGIAEELDDGAGLDMEGFPERKRPRGAGKSGHFHSWPANRGGSIL